MGHDKGGKCSKGRTKSAIKPKKSKQLAELIGIILGDGNLYWNNAQGVYAVRIAGDIEKEKEYHIHVIKPLIDSIFNINSKIEVRRNGRYVSEYGREIILRLEELGLKRGNKKENNVGIPQWVKEDNLYLTACIRGLIDTDGSVFRMSRKDPNLARIGFKNKSRKLLSDTRSGFIRLGFSPSKIFEDDHFFISKKTEIEKYMNEIRFNNPKHIDRLKHIAPSSSGQDSTPNALSDKS